MLTIIVATLIALGLACVVLIKGRAAESAQLDQPRPALLTIGVQIICGDCSGEGEQAVKTYLNRYGSCAQCGGNSYLLASSVAMNSLAARATRVRERQIAYSNGRVLPFEAPGSRTRERIAV